MANERIYLSSKSDLNNYLPKSGGNMTGNINLNANNLQSVSTLIFNSAQTSNINSNGASIGFSNRRITNVATPTSSTDAATKQYVDNRVIANSATMQTKTPTDSIPITLDICNIDFPNNIHIVSIYLSSSLDVPNVSSLFYVTHKLNLPSFITTPSNYVHYASTHYTNAIPGTFEFASVLNTDSTFTSVFEKQTGVVSLHASQGLLLGNFMYHA